MAHTTTLDVRFGDCDLVGIVYYPRLLHFCHLAFEDMWINYVGLPYADLIRDRRTGFPTVRVATDFRAPAKYGARVKIETWISRVGTSSVDFECEAVIDGKVAFRSSETKVCTNLDSFTPFPVPDDLRAKFERLGRD